MSEVLDCIKRVPVESFGMSIGNKCVLVIEIPLWDLCHQLPSASFPHLNINNTIHYSYILALSCHESLWNICILFRLQHCGCSDTTSIVWVYKTYLVTASIVYMHISAQSYFFLRWTMRERSDVTLQRSANMHFCYMWSIYLLISRSICILMWRFLLSLSWIMSESIDWC